MPNDILLKSATRLKPNHKTKDKHQTRFCFVGQTPNQNKEKWTVLLFENVESKSSPKWTNRKNIEKLDTFIFNLGDLAGTNSGLNNNYLFKF